MAHSLRKDSYQEARLYKDHADQLSSAIRKQGYSLYGEQHDMIFAEDADGFTRLERLSLRKTEELR